MLPGSSIAKCRRRLVYGISFLAIVSLLVASCSFSNHPSLMPSNLDSGWPTVKPLWQPKTALPANWKQGKLLWSAKAYPRLKGSLPHVPEAALVGLDAQCVICHETYVTAFTRNVHRQSGCEGCHGPAGRHITTRGEGPESILSLNTGNRATPSGRVTTPVERSEVCLRCHETNPAAPLGHEWRSSAHAHNAVECGDCHSAHYNVPVGTPPTVIGANGSGRLSDHVGLAQLLDQEGSLKGTSNDLGAATPAACYRCHKDMQRFEQADHPHQIGTPIRVPETATSSSWAHHSGTFDCTTCHDPHGNVRHETRKDLCLQCHDGPHMNEWHGSQHDLAEIGCTDCHNPHPTTGVSMSVDQPGVCYRCHSDTRQLEEFAGPHQIFGPNGFNCSTCHAPHGRVTMNTRMDQCLECHTGSPTMAWHSSFHFREGVACADCHNAHPDPHTPKVIGISHTSVERPNLRPMSVDQPTACYRCHPQIFAAANMPSHHPIREGKMVCSDCHESHGQGNGSLRAESLNQLCFECHAEKEGPFVWEHAPVTESCATCHEPHGTVANNLLHQPTTFLCLRCHTGHSTHAGSPQCNRCHLVNGDFTNVGGGPRDPTIPTTPSLRQALFTDCTQCHSQIHGSDNPSGFECGHGMRR